MSNFQNAKEKLTISSVDEPKRLAVKAQYNPKELEIQRAVGWGKHSATNKSKGEKEAVGIHLEFGGAEGRSLQIELLFDGYENKGMTDAYEAGEKGAVQDEKGQTPKKVEKGTVASQIKMLEEMASVRDPNSKKPELLRPHQCLVVWGNAGFAKFECVIESLTTKYQMFADDGMVLRATCTLKLKEANHLHIAKKEGAK